MTRLVLGIDGGGTKTEAVVLDSDAPERAPIGPIGRAGACNIAAMPVSDAFASILAATVATKAKPQQISAVVAAVAGFSFADRREELAEEIARSFPRAAIKIVPDYVAAFTGALNGAPGIVVIAGTGSVAYGENAMERTHRAGGYGYLIDDSGSGYGVGRSALSAVLNVADGTGPKTTLTERISVELGSASWEQIATGVYGGSIDRVRIAGLARVVALAAEEDEDYLARSILMHAGGALARMAEAVASRLFKQDEPFAVAGVGSLWEAGAGLTDVFDRSLARFAPKALRIAPTHGPAMGAALRALHLASGAP
jgi:N-acetylglucosamine kinase-like BadF-type ATPase